MRALPTLLVAIAALLAAGCADTKKTWDGNGPQADVDVHPLSPDLYPPGWEGSKPPVKYTIYAHTDTKLFKGDPSVSPLKLTQVGTFDCVGGTGQDKAMTDLAIDKDGKLFGVSQTGVYPLEVNGTTVHCASTWHLPTGSPFYGLTFAPAGVLGANEMLVAANSAGELWAIDSAGKTTQVGTFGKVPANDGHGHTYKNAGEDWQLSGDIVFMANEGKPLGFATVRDCPTPPSTCNSVDTLVEINVPALQLNNSSSVTKSVRGQVVKRSGCTDPTTTTGYGSVYGIAAWNDKVYGFSRGGELIEISNVDGTGCLVQSYDPEQWAGAGVTTVVPVKGPD
jgi:hypothetical protein